MLKSIFCSAALFCLAIGPGSSYAHCEEINPCYSQSYFSDDVCSHDKNQFWKSFLDTAQAKVAFFHPCSKKIRKIYPNWLGLCGLEIAGPSYCGFSPWITASYLSAHGHSLGEKHSTDLFYVPIGFGVNYLQNIDCATLYLGVGGLWSHLETKDYSCGVRRSTSRWDFGGIIKGGVIVYATECLFINVFADYSFMKFDSHGFHHGVYRTTADLSGYSFGASIGFKI